jgi:hypothetical protein
MHVIGMLRQYLGGVWAMFDGCLGNVSGVFGRCSGSVWAMFGWCLGDVLSLGKQWGQYEKSNVCFSLREGDSMR